MVFAADDLLASFIATRCRGRCFHRLAVQGAACRARLQPNPFAVQLQRHAMVGAQHQIAHEAPKSPVDRLQEAEVCGQRSPPTTATDHIADRVQHFAHVHLGLVSALRHRRQERSNPLSFIVRQVSWVTPVFSAIPAVRPPLAWVHIPSLHHAIPIQPSSSLQRSLSARTFLS